jgi:hypothetical protein
MVPGQGKNHQSSEAVRLQMLTSVNGSELVPRLEGSCDLSSFRFTTGR